MWELIKAEFSYYRYYVLIAYVMALPPMLGVIMAAGGINNLHLVRANTSVIIILIMLWALILPLIIGISGDRRTSKRTRLFVQLARPLNQLGLLYIVIPLFFWFSFLFLFWIIYLLHHPGGIQVIFVWRSIALTGFVILCVSVVLYPDLNFVVKTRRMRQVLTFLGPVCASAILLLFIFILLPPSTPSGLKPLKAIMLDLGSSALGSIMLILIGALGLIMGLWIFRLRKSYTE